MQKWARMFKKTAHWFVSGDARDLFKNVDGKARRRMRVTTTTVWNSALGESEIATAGVLAIDAGCGLFDCDEPDIDNHGDALATALGYVCERHEACCGVPEWVMEKARAMCAVKEWKPGDGAAVGKA